MLEEAVKNLIPEKKQNFPQQKVETKEKVVLETKKSLQPIAADKKPSKFSIKANLEKQEKKEEERPKEIKKEDLPNNHFTETDLQKEWILFLKDLQAKEVVIFNAISGFKLHKRDEDLIEVFYPSTSAKAEFDKVSPNFFNHFKHKVNHHRIEIKYKKDAVNLKKEIITKKSIYEKYIEINPLLKDLDNLFKFDFN